MDKRSMKPIPQAIVLLWVTVVGLTGIYAIIQGERQAARSEDRDAARAYQRCEQFVGPTTVVSIALDRVPRLAEHVHREAPGLLVRGDDNRYHLEVPDCARIYPEGAEVSHRYPDLTPTRDTP